MQTQTTPNERLDGWEEISSYLGWHPRTVIRWEKQKGLPVHRVPGGKRQPVYAYRHEIDAWFERTRVTTQPATPAAVIVNVERTTEESTDARSASLPLRRSLYFGSAISVLLVSVLAISWRSAGLPPIQIAGLAQFTDDGTRKLNLVTDNKQVYFGEVSGSKEEISTISVIGGSIRQIRVPFSRPSPDGISPDGKNLLVESLVENEDQHPLWIVPTSGGSPYRFAGLECTAAAWSPNGDWIAYGFDEGVYLISPDGLHSHLLAHFDGTPQSLVWSADEKHLLVHLRSLAQTGTSLWQLDLDSSLRTERTTLLHIPGLDCCRMEYLTRSGDSYFVVMSDSKGDRLLQLRPRLWRRRGIFEAVPLSTQFKRILGVAADAATKKLFILSTSQPKSELVRYDLPTQSFTIMLPGSSAIYLDISRDLAWAVYVNSATNEMWVSRVDGSDARQMSPPGMFVELPRWSPDGKSIAFMAKKPNGPYRIFVEPATGGDPREASQSEDDQGAPTWSPDGRYLVYGNVYCQEEHSCAIHRIELASGQVATLPNSKGLGTARWSPDGGHIAALDPELQELQVFDIDVQKWRKLADGINGNDVSWSSDSRYVYSKRSLNGQTEIVRVPMRGGAVQIVMDLATFSKSTGELDVWFSLTPDNTLMLNRWLDTSEIYALSYKER